MEKVQTSENVATQIMAKGHLRARQRELPAPLDLLHGKMSRAEPLVRVVAVDRLTVRTL